MTLAEGIRVQKDHLLDWKLKLNDEVYKALEKHALSTNHKAKSGSDICRGVSLSNFVLNYKPLKLWRYTNSTNTIWCSFDCGENEELFFTSSHSVTIQFKIFINSMNLFLLNEHS